MKVSNNVEEKYLNVQAVISLIFLFSICLTLLIITNKFINNKRKYKDLIETAKLDKMTDTYNREAGLNLLRDFIEERRASNNSLTICYIDINNLKYVNDNYGHSEGDKLIKLVADAIKKNLRETDAVARIGGDEFLVTFLDCTTSGAQVVLNRINEALKNLSMERKYEISISHGFYEIDPKINISIDHLIELADKEMYKLKKQYKKELAEI
ncbi:MAG: GGDEF domain-containing protein [Sedimentibacter sp.]